MEYKMPNFVGKIYKKWWFWVIIVFVFLVILGAGSPPENKKVSNEQSVQQSEKKEEVVENNKEDVIVNNPPEAKKQENLPETRVLPNNVAVKLYQVVKVVDGDTISVNIDGKVETLRLIGINTPETVDPRKPVECFGREASNMAKELLTNKKVRLEGDTTQDERDKYQRLLRYVWLEDGTFFNKIMISDGYAYEYTYNTPYKYQAEFKQAELEARMAKKGLWADGACSQETQPTSPVTTAPTNTPATDTSKINCSSNTYNCTDFKTQKEAQQVFDYCGGKSNDVHRLDADKDGIVCESLP